MGVWAGSSRGGGGDGRRGGEEEIGGGRRESTQSQLLTFQHTGCKDGAVTGMHLRS